MGNTNKIYEALLNKKEKIICVSEIVKTVKEFNKQFKASLSIENTIKYLTRHNCIKRIFNGYYYINSFDEKKRNYCIYEDKELLFSVLNKMNFKWYLGFSSALYLLKKSWQIPAIISIINNKISGKRKILGLTIRFYKIKENLIFGLKNAKTRSNITFFYSDQAKTHLDMVYYKISDKLAHNEDIKKYLKRYPKWFGRK